MGRPSFASRSQHNICSLYFIQLIKWGPCMPVNYPKKYDDGTQYKMKWREKRKRLGRLWKTILGTYSLNTFRALMEDSKEIFHDPLQSKLVSLQKYIGILTCPKKSQQHVSTKVNWSFLVVGKMVHLQKLGVWGTCTVQKPAPKAFCTGLKSSIFVVEIGTEIIYIYIQMICK